MRFLSAVRLLIEASLMTRSLFVLSLFESRKKKTFLFSKGSASQNRQKGGNHSQPFIR